MPRKHEPGEWGHALNGLAEICMDHSPHYSKGEHSPKSKNERRLASERLTRPQAVDATFSRNAIFLTELLDELPKT